MAVNCSDPNSLMAAAKCMKCIPTGMQPEVIIYLLQQLAGNTMTPNQLMTAAKCMKCIPAGAQPEVQTYLLCAIANAAGA
jgi:hypothetical protein